MVADDFVKHEYSQMAGLNKEECVCGRFYSTKGFTRYQALKESQTKGEILFFKSRGKTDGHMLALLLFHVMYMIF
jgi:hypothetical protein